MHGSDVHEPAWHEQQQPLARIMHTSGGLRGLGRNLYVQQRQLPERAHEPPALPLRWDSKDKSELLT